MVTKNKKASDDLRPKPIANRCPQGIKTFTVCRQSDETGVSGEGIVMDGVIFSTGQCVVHWLYPPPKGSITIWESYDDFIKVHIKPHPKNKTIITYDDGTCEEFDEDE